ncbi:hypothetical protein JAAARDRAFT_28513 [Jaapia argillacea MUCL 33604]|uniref:Uncharacterized protein n=1 Tax=Jaapia argillacea MUCL 33604 TaxID=933084 RepID=A0A067QMU4_9AGAM|nr:hypothetical protein JAAARDRAFT_28513 [Jaapia argillacea MUCL 33604]
MSVNNDYLVRHIAGLETPTPSSPNARRRVSSEPCLPLRLPSASFIIREAEMHQKRMKREDKGRHKELPSPPDVAPDPEDEILKTPTSPSPSTSPSSPTNSLFKRMFSTKKTESPAGPWRPPETFEVFRAIDRKDMEYLIEVRDRSFDLLLRWEHDMNATPLVYAMRLGPSHRDVAIILLGAFSRWVNNLSDEDIQQPNTKNLLKTLRTNLKMAIDHGLQTSQTDLIASYFQTLIMSEGDRWIHSQITNLRLALRSGTAGKPVTTAEDAVRTFATKQLGKSHAIAALEDYIANATSDLLMMAAWSTLLDYDSIHGELIPVWYFARDDRVYKAFCTRLDQNRTSAHHVGGRRLRWQIRVLRSIMEGRNVNYRRKVELLKNELDEGSGV